MTVSAPAFTALRQPLLRPKLEAWLLGLALAWVVGCGPSSQGPVEPDALLPADAYDRALHCYLVLTLTIDQLTQFEGTGPQDGFRARRSTDELRRARTRMAGALEEATLDELRADPWPRLERLLQDFDADGDGQLSTRAEVETFNSHVAACTRPGSS